ncbi:MAG TPA: SDR family NAD(P)-dependent oxidoreductase [Polyangia bacterium]
MNETPARALSPAPSDSTPAFDVAGQIALVTGAARGIGRASALALARAGADLALGFRDATASGDVADAVRALGRRALPLQMNVVRPAEIEPAVAEAIRHPGRLDILVNNAGIGPPNPAVAVTEADFDATLAVNLKGTFFVSQAVGRAMIAGGRGGRIVNLSSQAGFVALPTGTTLMIDGGWTAR